MRTLPYVLAAAAMIAAASPSARACSLVMWSDNGQAVVVARNMDWAAPMPVDLWALPRGIARHGHTAANPIRWTARYGSVVASHDGTSDGMNEKGLSAHLLWLTEADYGHRDASRPGLSAGMWAQYFLDNFATVAEAVAVAKAPPFQVAGGAYQGRTVALHLALRDKSGDAAVIEYVGGVPKVYHGRNYPVMTNSPPFDQQLTGLARYKGFGGNETLPGTTDAADRFVRAAFYLSRLPKPVDQREAVAGVLSIARNVAQPFGTPDPLRPYISATRWRTVADLTNRVYFFETTLNPGIVWLRLDHIDFRRGQPVRRIDMMKHADAVGDVTAKLRPAKEFAVQVGD